MNVAIPDPMGTIPDLTQKVAVITGATGGMGQIIAAGLAHAGAHVITIARNPPARMLCAPASVYRQRIGSTSLPETSLGARTS